MYFILLKIGVSLSGLLLWSAASRWRQGRRFAAGRRAGLGLIGLPLLIGGFGLGTNLYTYHALTRETPVAELRFERLSDRHYVAELHPTDAEPRRFELHGDEWQLDVRMIKWTGIGTLLGLEPLYRLDRLSGRFSAVDDARGNPPSVHALTADSPGLDLWSIAREYPLGLIDAGYGNAVFLPMHDGARYQIQMTSSGLIARRADAAKESIGDRLRALVDH
ncbi:MAG: hypothetical protein H6981_09600 [Gammaproteobacteria bacterium]|nr:hypothetical protein [Gammaproteobacteria bacterium]MCP5137041.1 hypothetical protein [Gammaproteobacteria bacterium]